MDGTIRFPLLLRVGINCYFLLSDRLLICRHALKWKVLNQHFLLLSGHPPKHTNKPRRNSRRQMKKMGGNKIENVQINVVSRIEMVRRRHELVVPLAYPWRERTKAAGG
jgi:hypothetical protein